LKLDPNVPIAQGWIKPVKVRGRRLNKSGYVWISVVDHYIVGTCTILEHRLVLAEKIGRKLNNDEVPHHDKVRDTTYNHPDNLVLMNWGEHIGLHNKARMVSEETRAKMSASRLGNKYLLGHKHSKETRAKMSKSHMGWNGHTVLRDRKAKAT
jgi:hypothetical protein